VASLDDRSTVLTFPNGERLTVDNGVFAQLEEVKAGGFAAAVHLKSATRPESEMIAPLADWLAETRSVAYGLARVPAALAAALEEQRGARADPGSVERALRELLDAEAVGFSATWRGRSPQRVRLRLEPQAHRALAELLDSGRAR
jgi:hypothetical protein